MEQATTVDQRVVSGTVETLPALAAAAGVAPPTLIVIGEVVRMRTKLDWFTKKAAAEDTEENLTHRTPRTTDKERETYIV